MQKTLTLTVAALATVAVAAPAQAGTFICVPPQAGVAVVSGGPNGTCDSVSTPVQLPTAAADQQTLMDILPYIKYAKSGVGEKPTIYFNGVNLNLQKNTATAANASDGTGNLVIGKAWNPFYRARTGSDNLVAGIGHGWTGNGNVIGGAYNTAGGTGYNTVFGTQNTLSAGAGQASILGGTYNHVSAASATVAGGRSKSATTAEQLIADGAPISQTHWAKFDATGKLLGSSEPLEDYYPSTYYVLAKFRGVDLKKCAVNVESAEGRHAITTWSDYYGYVYARSLDHAGNTATSVPYDITATCDK
jgi:hypothetical protein